jgi:DNA-binding LacI/PurR family transcriptional regulator
VAESNQSPQGPRAVTISDVADAAGVSTATVSHVFSGHRPVSARAAKRVLAAAQELGYTINAVAQGLATGRSFVVALHLPFDAEDIIVNPFLVSLLTTISSTASAAGYGFILIPPDETTAAAHAASLIAGRRIDGALLLDPIPPGALRDTLDSADLPVVTIGRTEDRDQDIWVDGDLEAQVGDALTHLQSRGYSRTALLLPKSRSIFFRYLQEHYQAWCGLHDWAPLVFTAGALTEDAASRALAGRLADFDSLFCANDILATGALQAVSDDPERGALRAGVIGIGDSYYARHARPALTSIDTHTAEKGRMATELLLALIAGGTPEARHVVVPHELVVRKSTPWRTVPDETRGDPHGSAITAADG